MRRRLSKFCWILVLAALVGGCTQPTTPTRLPSPSRTVDYAGMETAIEDKISSGSLNLSTINAALVSVGGETKVAHYRNGSKPQDALHVWSVTKSVVSALIGIAIDEKIISGPAAGLYSTGQPAWALVAIRDSGTPLGSQREATEPMDRLQRCPDSHFHTSHRRLGRPMEGLRRPLLSWPQSIRTGPRSHWDERVGS